MKKNMKWNTTELELVRKMIEQGQSHSFIGKKLGRTANSVCKKCVRENIKSKSKMKTHKDYMLELPSSLLVLEEYKGNKVKILHKHSCGYEWRVRPDSILGNSSICPKCKNRKTTKQYKNELPSDLDILEEYLGVMNKILHKHSCGYEWKTTPNHILSGKSCPKCAQHGFKIDLPACTYLIYFPKLGLYKVGVTNNISKRLNSFVYKANVILYRQFNLGKDALSLERKWLENIKHLKVNTGLLASGNTETFKI